MKPRPTPEMEELAKGGGLAPWPCPQHLRPTQEITETIASLAPELSQLPASEPTISHSRRADGDLQEVGSEVSQDLMGSLSQVNGNPLPDQGADLMSRDLVSQRLRQGTRSTKMKHD